MNDPKNGTPLRPNIEELLKEKPWAEWRVEDGVSLGKWALHLEGQLALTASEKSGRSTADDLRAAGWTVAIHNDYSLARRFGTFWLLTKDGRAVKGEGSSDAEALDQVREQIPDVLDGTAELEAAKAKHEEQYKVLSESYGKALDVGSAVFDLGRRIGLPQTNPQNALEVLAELERRLLERAPDEMTASTEEN